MAYLYEGQAALFAELPRTPESAVLSVRAVLKRARWVLERVDQARVHAMLMHMANAWNMPYAELSEAWIAQSKQQRLE